MPSPVYADIGPTATLTDLFISLAVVFVSGIGTYTVTLVVGSLIGVPHSIGGTSTSGTDGY